MRQLLQICHLHRAADINPHRLEVIKKARQMQTRSAYIVDRDVDFFIVRRLVKKVQIKLVDQL